MEADSRAHLMARGVSDANLPRAFQLSLTGAEAELRNMIVNGDILPTATRQDGMYRGWTLLHAAASKGHLNVATMLLQAGARVTDRSANGKTATMMALDKGHHAVANICQAAESGAMHPAPPQHMPPLQQNAPPPPPPSSGPPVAFRQPPSHAVPHRPSLFSAAPAAPPPARPAPLPVALPAQFYPQAPLAPSSLPAAATSQDGSAKLVERLLQAHQARVSEDGRLLAVVTSGCFNTLCGTAHAAISALCEKFKTRVDAKEEVDGFYVLSLYEFPTRRAAEGFLWAIVGALNGHEACGVAFPMASGDPSPEPPQPELSTEVCAAVARASGVYAVTKRSGAVFVSSANAASIHTALLLLTHPHVAAAAEAMDAVRTGRARSASAGGVLSFGGPLAATNGDEGSRGSKRAAEDVTSNGDSSGNDDGEEDGDGGDSAGGMKRRKSGSGSGPVG